jgi:hypothetical protein
MPGEGTGKTILTQTILFLVLSQRLKRLNPDPQWRVGNWGTIAMRTDKIPALSNSESAMTEAEFNRLLDAVRMAIEPAGRPPISGRKRQTTKWPGRSFHFLRAGTAPASRARFLVAPRQGAPKQGDPPRFG